MTVIDFSKLNLGSSKVLAGHLRGVAAREHFKVDSLDDSNDVLTLVFPDIIETVSPSFVQGFMGGTAKGKTKAEIMSRLDLSKLSKYIKEDILIGLDRLLLRRSAGH